MRYYLKLYIKLILDTCEAKVISIKKNKLSIYTVKKIC